MLVDLLFQRTFANPMLLDSVNVEWRNKKEDVDLDGLFTFTFTNSSVCRTLIQK